MSNMGVRLLLLLAVLAIIGDEASARQPLQGSATITQTQSEWGAVKTPWHPRQGDILRADAMVRVYRLNSAEEIYRQALARNPKNAGAWNGLGKIAAARAESSDRVTRRQAEQFYADATQAYFSALRYQPGYVEAHLNLARLCMARNQHSLAKSSIDRALSLSPSSSDALTLKAEWLLSQGQAAEALPLLLKANKIHQNSHTNAILAQAYMKLGDWEKAFHTVHVALSQNPTSHQNYMTLGELQVQRGNEGAAEVAYLEAARLKPASVPIRMAVVDFYEKRGDFRKAAEQLKSLVNSEDVEWPLVSRVGKLSIKSGQPDVAVHYYRQWLDRHPDDPVAQADMSYAKRELARQKTRNDDLISQGEAKRYAEQSIQYNPENYEARLIAAKLDREMKFKQEKKPAEWVDVALSQTDYRPSQAYERADLLLNRYQFDEARKAFREARLADVSPRGQMVYGELLLTKGLPSLAEEAFRQVLQTLPGNTSARLGMAKAEDAREKSLVLSQQAKKVPPSIAAYKLQEAIRLDAENADAYYLLAKLEEDKKNYAVAADYYYAYQGLCKDPDEARRIGRKIESLKKKISKNA